MTLNELSQLYYLKREVKSLRGKILELESRATNTSVRISDMPHGKSAGDKIGTIAPQLALYRAELTRSLERCCTELRKLNAYITACPDSLTRQILTLRFVDGLTWNQVAARIGGTSEYAVKKIVYRHLRTERRE